MNLPPPSWFDLGFIVDIFGELGLFVSSTCGDSSSCSLGGVGFDVVDCFSSCKTGVANV